MSTPNVCSVNRTLVGVGYLPSNTTTRKQLRNITWVFYHPGGHTYIPKSIFYITQYYLQHCIEKGHTTVQIEAILMSDVFNFYFQYLLSKRRICMFPTLIPFSSNIHLVVIWRKRRQKTMCVHLGTKRHNLTTGTMIISGWYFYINSTFFQQQQQKNTKTPHN